MLLTCIHQSGIRDLRCRGQRILALTQESILVPLPEDSRVASWQFGADVSPARGGPMASSPGENRSNERFNKGSEPMKREIPSQKWTQYFIFLGRTAHHAGSGAGGLL
ncbi:hypothetical protein LIER_42544 [Lithospermum erythrorhizon]|uniref:Uncharacterized protein n=1 Tax=Lithospermum erythrorhizon TaxID=34254 RepID=A0AAV3NH40_LITER